ncbi:MAG: hypothetical protein J5510_08140 [Prevotella sp.]|nr:hypothetical protein [Prevotella sp.]
MAKKSDNRVDKFREEGMAFIAEHFKDMEDAFKAYTTDGKDKNWDKAVALYFKLADKVLPALPTQATETASTEKPEWQKKIEQMKKTQSQ